MLWTSNALSHVVVTLNHKVIPLLFHKCNFATLMNHNVNIWHAIPSGIGTHSLRTTALANSGRSSAVLKAMASVVGTILVDVKTQDVCGWDYVSLESVSHQGWSHDGLPAIYGHWSLPVAVMQRPMYSHTGTEHVLVSLLLWNITPYQYKSRDLVMTLILASCESGLCCLNEIVFWVKVYSCFPLLP